MASRYMLCSFKTCPWVQRAAIVLRAKHGYPEMTPSLRAKIFGLNGVRVYGLSVEEVKRFARRDRVAQERAAYREQPEPSFLTYGPKTRREFLSFKAVE